MRLIDADALEEIYKLWIPQLSSKEDEGDKRGVETCIAVLQDAPTIEAQPVMYGKWSMFSANLLSCSVCGDLIPLTEKSNFCPNCGAKMVKEGGVND